MPINITSNAIITSTWTNFKSSITSKSLSVQYFDDGVTYTIFSFDGPTAYTCNIWKGAVPDSVISGGYSQAQNDSDKSDFTTNWQPSSNQQNSAIISTGTLGSLNATAQIAIGSNQTVGLQINAGTFIGNILTETSFDNGANWNQSYFSITGSFTKQSVIGFVSANTATAATIIVPGGTCLVRVRAFTYTSGTCNVTLRASNINDPTLVTFASPPANGMPPTLAIIGGSVTTSAPSYSTGLANAISLNTSGGLRVDGSGVTMTDNITQIGGVSVAAVAKGTQASNALGTQDMKDSGRVSYVAVGVAVTGVTSEALITLTPIRTVTAGSTGTSLTVTAGKTMRLEGLSVSIRNTSTTQAGAIVRLRMNAGTVLVGSQAFFAVATTALNALAGGTNQADIDFPDGFEISGTTQFGISQLCSTTSCTIDVTLYGFEY